MLSLFPLFDSLNVFEFEVLIFSCFEPDLYGVQQPVTTVQAPSTTSLQAPPSVASGFVTAQGVSEDKGISEAAEEAEKQARKKKKEKVCDLCMFFGFFFLIFFFFQKFYLYID